MTAVKMIGELVHIHREILARANDRDTEYGEKFVLYTVSLHLCAL